MVKLRRWLSSSVATTVVIRPRRGHVRTWRWVRVFPILRPPIAITNNPDRAIAAKSLHDLRQVDPWRSAPRVLPCARRSVTQYLRTTTPGQITRGRYPCVNIC